MDAKQKRDHARAVLTEVLDALATRKSKEWANLALRAAEVTQEGNSVASVVGLPVIIVRTLLMPGISEILGEFLHAEANKLRPGNKESDADTHINGCPACRELVGDIELLNATADRVTRR